MDVGDREGILTIYNEDMSNETLTVKLSGTGKGPGVTVDPETLDFDVVYVLPPFILFLLTVLTCDFFGLILVLLDIEYVFPPLFTWL